MALHLRFYKLCLSLLMFVGMISHAMTAHSADALKCAELLKSHQEQNQVWTNWEDAKPQVPKSQSTTLLLKLPVDAMSFAVQELVDPSWVKGTSVEFIREFSVLDRMNWFSIVNGDQESLARMDKLLSPVMRSKLQYISLESSQRSGQMQLPVPGKMIEIDIQKESLDKALDKALLAAADESVAIYAGGHFLMGAPRKNVEVLSKALLASLEINEISATADLNMMSDSLKSFIARPSHLLFNAPAFRALKAHEGQNLNLGPMTADEAFSLLEAKLKSEPCKAAVCVTPVADVPDLSELVLAWKKHSGVSWAEKNFLDKSLAVLLEKFVPDTSRPGILALRAAQKEGLSDGEMLRRVSKQENAGAPVVARFTELWSALALSLDPRLEGDVFSIANRARILEILDSGKIPEITKSEVVVAPVVATTVKEDKAQKAAKTEKAKKPAVARASKKADSGEGQVSGDSMTLISSFVFEQTQMSMYKAGQLPVIFAALTDKLAAGNNAEDATKRISAIGFGNSDGANARVPSSAQRRVLSAFRVLVSLIDVELAQAPSNDEWVAKAIQKLKSRVGAAPTLPEPELLPRPQINSILIPRDQAKTGERESTLPTGPMADNVIVRGVRDFGAFENAARSEHLAHFMREHAYLGVLKPRKTNEYEIAYVIPGDDRATLVSYSVQPAVPGGTPRLNITDLEEISKDQESLLYLEIAKVHHIRPLQIILANGKKLHIGPVKASEFNFSAKVYAKLQVKHRLNENKIRKLLNKASTFVKAEVKNFSSEIELDGVTYKLFVYVVDNRVEVQTLYPMNAAKIKSYAR